MGRRIFAVLQTHSKWSILSDKRTQLGIACCATLSLPLILTLSGAQPIQLLRFSIAAFWLAALPGTLLFSATLRRSKRELPTWILGTALGINILPFCFVIAGFVTQDAHAAWWVIGAIISFANVVGLARMKKEDQGGSPTKFPFIPLVILVALFFGLYLSHHFSRDSTAGVLRFSTYFGGDIPFLSAFVTNFEKTTLLQDLHYGGAVVAYHDFVLRFMAGLHFFAGGEIMDAMWYWLVGFDFLLLTSIVWIVTMRLTSSRIASAVAVLGIFFFPGKTSELFVFVSSSFRLGLVEAFLAFYLVLELYQHHDKKLRARAGWLLVFVATLFVGWKLTDFVILLPVLLLVGFEIGRREKRWELLSYSLLASVLGGIYIVVAYSQANLIAGTEILGRPLVDLAHFFNAHFGSQLNPVASISHLSSGTILSILLLLIPLMVSLFAVSGRFLLSLTVFPKLDRRQSFPYFTLFIIAVMLLGHFFGIFLSKEYFFYGDAYQPLFADAFGLIVLGCCVDASYQAIKRRERSTKTVLIIGLTLIGLGVDAVNAAHGYHWLGASGYHSLPIRLTQDLDSASHYLKPNSLVATHRFNLNKKYDQLPLSPAPRKSDVDWNFEFYAEGLKAPIILEGPADGEFGPAAAPWVDSSRMALPNPLVAPTFWRKSRLLDSVYISNSANALAALDSLGATHVLIDHTIGQSLAPVLVEACDTVFTGSTITLLKRRK